MLLITCPYCGERDQSEFVHGGRKVEFPALEAGAAEWHQAIHSRSHSSESISECWYHESGCESWFLVDRCMQTHQFLNSDTGDDSCS